MFLFRMITIVSIMSVLVIGTPLPSTTRSLLVRQTFGDAFADNFAVAGPCRSNCTIYDTISKIQLDDIVTATNTFCLQSTMDGFSTCVQCARKQGFLLDSELDDQCILYDQAVDRVRAVAGTRLAADGLECNSTALQEMATCLQCVIARNTNTSASEIAVFQEQLEEGGESCERRGLVVIVPYLSKSGGALHKLTGVSLGLL